MVAGFRDDVIILATSPSLLVVLVISSEPSSLHVAPRHGAVVI